jgi:hypothetical protein
MLNKGNRISAQPILVQNQAAKSLDRIPIDTRVISEGWIQELIHSNPGILPISEIDTGFTPAIPIGREVFANSGYIDNLFISPDGYLTIVETKLWRNPEARREVVGQIIDYAREISKWTFTELDNVVKQFNRLYAKNGDDLLATVRRHVQIDEPDENIFIDNISKNLKRGRFLLLVVGDGIRESVEDMVDYLSQSPQLHFTLGLVELQVYKLNQDDGSLIIIPQLVARTKEITRAIVRIEGNHSADVKINIETDLGKEITKPGYKRTTITEEDFFDQLRKNTNGHIVTFVNQFIEDVLELGLYIEWNSGSFTARFPDPEGSGIKIALVNIERDGRLNLGLSKPQFEKLQLPREISFRFASDTAKLFPGTEIHATRKHLWAKSRTIDDLQRVYPQFMERFKTYLQEIRFALQNIGQ